MILNGTEQVFTVQPLVCGFVVGHRQLIPVLERALVLDAVDKSTM